MKLTQAEHVVDLMCNQISLSRYDKRLMINLQILNVNTGKPITTNQLELFKKVVLKYSRQLQKLGLNAVELALLPWQVTPVKSDELLSKAHLHIMDGNKLTLHSPYRPKFVKEFREAQLMEWLHEDKFYIADFSLYKLRCVLDIVNKHYVDVQYCDEIRDILLKINEHRSIKYWEPTLVKRHGNLYVMALNEPLYNAIKDIEINDSFECLVNLSKYGITIDDELLSSFDETEVTVLSSHTIKHEVHDIKGLINILKKINTDLVVCAGFRESDNMYSLRKKLRNNNIRAIDGKEKQFTELVKSSNNPVMIKFLSMGFGSLGSKFMTKVFYMVNSDPVEIVK